METPDKKSQTVDYRLAFELAPVGMVLSRHRNIIDCNARLCEMFGTTRDALVGQSFQVLYPSVVEFERIGNVAFRGMSGNCCLMAANISTHFSGCLVSCRW